MSAVIPVSTTRSTKRNRVYTAPRRNEVLVNLVNGPATAQEVQAGPSYLICLEDQGLVKRADTVKTGKPGRPAIKWALTDKGRKRAKRALAKVA
jgi:hypothetical protein